MFVTADETLGIFMLKPSTPLFAGIPYTRLARLRDLGSMCSQRPAALGSLLPLCDWRGECEA